MRHLRAAAGGDIEHEVLDDLLTARARHQIRERDLTPVGTE
jgi:hypothetical protein